MPNEPLDRFRLGTFSGAGHAYSPGLVLADDTVILLEKLTPLLQRLDLRLEGVESILRLLSGWEANFAALTKVAATLGAEGEELRKDLGAVALDRLHIHAPVHVPRQIFCAIEHGSDSAPQACLKLPSTVIGPNDPLEIPRHAREVDWGVELGVVIGTVCRRVPRAEAMACIAGFTVVNDLTLRDLVPRPDLPGTARDWFQSKNCPGLLPTGPFLVPAAFISDPYALRLQLFLNGEPMQDARASDMLFDIATQIEYISQHAQLLPGDIICTGTPAGRGTQNERFLQPGDVIDARIEGVGAHRTRCIPEAD